MRKIAIALAVLALPAVAALPAAAQDWGSRDRGSQNWGSQDWGSQNRGWNHDSQDRGMRDWSDWNTQGRSATGFVDGLQWQISYAERTGRISHDQANWLMRRENEAKPIAWRVQTGTASWDDRRQLNQDVNDIENTLTRSYHTYRGYRRDNGWNGWGGDDRRR